MLQKIIVNALTKPVNISLRPWFPPSPKIRQVRTFCITGCEWMSHRLRMRAEVRHRWTPSATMRTLRRNLLCDKPPNEMFQNIAMHAWLTPLYTELRLVSVVSENAARRQRKYL
jgi:hypothetical protein